MRLPGSSRFSRPRSTITRRRARRWPPACTSPGFHFDRLVSAAAGEPPATLRRRVLLERAAHRLVTTTDEVLPVAIDAGYASHEAFTRAFTRAYGQPPSRWRRHPTAFRLEAPSNVHFHPPGALRVPAEER